ncbi:MAG: nucleoside deaminase [Bacteroidetes bacterium]|nr:nucleoside deaminase [Fibrella sp.]
MNDEFFLRKAIDLARDGMNSGQGGPFGAVVVRDGVILSATANRVIATNDPTAHAEVVAIREACARLNSYQLTGCTLYTSCEPCPMCLGAVYWARPDRIVYAAFHADAAEAGFDDKFIYDELDKPRDARSIPMTQLLRADARAVFAEWVAKGDKSLY